MRAHEGRGADLADLLLEAAGEVGGAAGCHVYAVSRPADDDDAVHVFEVWETREAHAASLDLPGVEELIARARPLLAAAPESLELRPLGGPGLPRSERSAPTG